MAFSLLGIFLFQDFLFLLFCYFHEFLCFISEWKKTKQKKEIKGLWHSEQ